MKVNLENFLDILKARAQRGPGSRGGAVGRRKRKMNRDDDVVRALQEDELNIKVLSVS